MCEEINASEADTERLKALAVILESMDDVTLNTVPVM